MTDAPRTANTVWHPSAVARSDRWAATAGPSAASGSDTSGSEASGSGSSGSGSRVGGVTVWLTGLSGSGKSSVAVELERQLIEARRPAYLLDGDNLRQGLNGDLGFSAEDRDENVRRVGHVARLFCDAGIVAIVPLISPYRAARDFARALHDAAELPFVEVFIDTPLEICEQRDPKGLYAKARAGEITGMTGIDDPYEAPLNPERRYTPDDGSASEVAAKLLASL